jgi:carbonic anhydrase/acetyltransferase-like protein (isoleucine patch superfamily)
MNVIRNMIDGVLLRFRARLDHLAIHSPSRYREEMLRQRAVVGRHTRLFDGANLGAPREDQISIGDYCHVMGEILVLAADARCSIGHHCSLGRDSRIWAQSSVTIGNYVLIAHMVDIHDNNSHSLDWRDRREDAVNVFEHSRPLDVTKVETSPVVIEDDVWIGAKSTILKGVHIGRGAVIAAGSLVTKDVPPFTLVAGNPARVIRTLDE